MSRREARRDALRRASPEVRKAPAAHDCRRDLLHPICFSSQARTQAVYA